MTAIACSVWTIVSVSAVFITFKWYLPSLHSSINEGDNNSKTHATKPFQIAVYLVAIMVAIGCGYRMEVRQVDWINASKILLALSVLNIVSITDVILYKIPNLCVVILLVGRCLSLIPELICSDGTFFIGMINSLLAGSVCLLFLLVLSKMTNGGIGYGDVKLFGALGFLGGVYAGSFFFLVCNCFQYILDIWEEGSKRRIANGPVYFSWLCCNDDSRPRLIRGETVLNTTKVLTGLILICLMIFGGFSLLLSDGDTDKLEYDKAVALANDYVKRELYQLAIVEYEKAVAILDSEELRGSIMDAYEKRYEEAPEILDAYIDAAKAAISKYPQTTDYYVILAKNQERNSDLQAAYKTIDRAKRSGISSDQLEEIYTRIAYLYDIKWYTHEDYHPCVAGFYPVKEDGKWGYLSEEGDHKSGFDYVFASQIGEEGIRILCADKNVLEDEKKIIRGILSFVPSAAGIYSEGLVAIQNGKEYGYYDSLGDYKFGSYFRASNFSNGKAAVSVKEGEWFFIDASGKRISDNTYQEIRLNLDGSYHKCGVMLAKSGGKYRLYNQQEERIGNFECDDVDVQRMGL